MDQEHFQLTETKSLTIMILLTSSTAILLLLQKLQSTILSFHINTDCLKIHIVIH